MITKEQILNDPDIPVNYIDKERNWVNEAFLDGIDYAERKQKSPWIDFKESQPHKRCLACLVDKNAIWYALANFQKEYGEFYVYENHRRTEVSYFSKVYWMPIPKLEEELNK